ncbi:MAG: N-acetyltransferase [Candidatus Accumulibacter sp. 66-26]|nr:N-acetyltransferase [Accumulibacter sp.]OJW50097.1 MAG: N-acetyltransferase [Candidatus Accumulibacter sp. 66-26]
MELRIDVKHRPDELDTELETLYRRLYRPGDSLHGIATIATNFPELVFRYREADGEHYVYVEDVARRRLAGYTVFNRLIEVGRRADPYLRAPHSKYATPYQRRGISTAVYEWGLGRGFCLISGARQSTGANALWHALARRHELGYLDVRDKTLRYLGREVDRKAHDDLHTRMILLGKEWSIERLAALTGMRLGGD